jgi:predicted dehydrogenase
MTDRVRLGFIGAGWWSTAVYIPRLATREDVELSAVCRRSPSELEQVRESFGFRFATPDYRELVEQPLDGVVVTSPHSLHYEHAKAALEHGLHVMVDKPFALKATEAWELVELGRAKGLHVLVPYGYNYSPFAAEAHRLLSEGALGEIEHVLCHKASSVRQLLEGNLGPRGFGKAMFAPQATTWADPSVAGGGYGVAQLTHALGLLFYIAPLRAASVYAEMASPTSQVELYDAISARFTNGATGSISGAGGVPRPFRPQVDIRIFGREGMMLLDVERERLELHRHDGKDFVLPMQPGDGTYTCDTPPDRFVDLIKGLDVPNQSSGEVGARVVELLDAAYRSSESGKREAILQ